MSTKAQVKANRKNAKKSTGPKTTEGKEKASQNATKHGFFACQDVIKSESQLEFDMLSSEMLEELNPIGPMETILADRIVSLTWRLKRAARMQNMAIDFLLEKDADKCASSLIRNYGEPHEKNPELALGRAADRDFSHNRTLDRLILYERRIENSLYKTIKELKQLKKDKENATRTTQHTPQERAPEVTMPYYPPDKNEKTNPILPVANRRVDLQVHASTSSIKNPASSIEMQNEPNTLRERQETSDERRIMQNEPNLPSTKETPIPSF